MASRSNAAERGGSDPARHVRCALRLWECNVAKFPPKFEESNLLYLVNLDVLCDKCHFLLVTDFSLVSFGIITSSVISIIAQAVTSFARK